jgi:multiple sugar transport system substrate-binding protein
MEYTMNAESWRLRSAIGISIASLLAVAPLAGCSSGAGAGAGSGKTTITFSYLWGGPEGQSLEKLISEYNASQSQVKVIGVSSPDSQKQLTSMSSSNGSFDISDSFGNTVGAWASKGILAPLDSYLSPNNIDISDFAPSAMSQMKYQGKTYSLPIAVHTFELLYNKKLLDAAGLKPPTTMDELAADAAKLTKTDASGKITQLGFGSPDDPTTLTTLGYAFGGSWDGANAPTPDDPGNVKALAWYQDNIVKKVGADKLATFVAGEGQYLSAQDPFYTGKIAMLIDGEWRSASAGKVAPGLDWGVAPIPTAGGGPENSTQVTASTLFIPANSKHKDAAAKFLAYMVSKKAMTAFTVALGNLPSRISLVGDSAYKALPNFTGWATALKSPNAKSLASKPYSAEYTTDLGTAFNQVVRDAATPDQALKQVKSRVSTYATH